MNISEHRVLCGERVVLARCEYGNSMKFRTRGLLGRERLAEDEGILLKPCNSIHMFGMKFAIDAVFIDKDGIVLHICHSIRPWRISKLVWRSKMVLETAAGWAQRHGVKLGDMLRFDPGIEG